MIIVPLSEVIADGSPKTKLIEILGLLKDASIDEKLFDFLVGKLEELDIAISLRYWLNRSKMANG